MWHEFPAHVSDDLSLDISGCQPFCLSAFRSTVDIGVKFAIKSSRADGIISYCKLTSRFFKPKLALDATIPPANLEPSPTAGNYQQ